MTQPLLSIVTPSYNQAEFIGDVLDSVRRGAGVVDLEHVVVDGGSDDGTVDILEQYEEKYPLRWISEPDRGQSHAINKGIEMAKGEWIGWQNADDYYLPGAFEAFEYGLRSRPSADVIYGDQQFVDVDGAVVGKRYHTRPSKFIQKHREHFAANSSLFVRHRVLDELGGIDEAFEYTMDAELFWRLLSADLVFEHVPQFVGVRRLHEGAKTSEKDAEQYRWELERLYEYSWLERWLPDTGWKLAAILLKTAYLIEARRVEGINHMYRELAENNLPPRLLRATGLS